MADRYWVGGTGTWNTTSTTNWSATSGGAGGASVPTAADNVIFDSATTYTVTMTGALTCLDFTVSAGTVTFAQGTSPTLAISGNLSLVAATVWNMSSTVTFNATTSKTIGVNNVFINSVNFNGAAGTWTLTSAIQFGNVTITNGTFSTSASNYSVSWYNITIAANSNIKALSLNGSTTVYAQSFNNNSTGNFTFNAGTSTINVGGTGGGDVTYYSTQSLTFYNFSSTDNFNNSITFSGVDSSVVFTFNNLTFTSGTYTNRDRTLIIPANVSTTNMVINGTLTMRGSAMAPGSRVILRGQDFTSGSSVQARISAAAVSLVDVDFYSINNTGVSSWTGARLGDMTNNTNITTSTPRTVYYSAATLSQYGSGNPWANTSGGTAVANNYPLVQDVAVIDNSSGNGTLTLGSVFAGTVNASSRTFSMNIAPSGAVFFKDFLLSPNVTQSGITTIYFYGTGNSTFTTSNVNLSLGVVVSKANANVTFTGNVTSNQGFTLTSGTLNLNGNTLTTTSVSGSTSVIRSINFGTTGSIVITGTGNWDFRDATNLTLSGSKNVIFTNNTSTAPSIINDYNVGLNATGGNNLPNFYFTGGTYTFGPDRSNFGTLDFTGFNGTFNSGDLTGIYGSIILSSTMTMGYFSRTYLRGVSGQTNTLDFKSKSITLIDGADSVIDGPNVTWILASDMPFIGVSIFRPILHANGTINLNGKTLSCNTGYTTLDGIKNLTFNGGTLSCNGSFNNDKPGGFTVTQGTGTGKISMTSASAKNFVGGSNNYSGVILSQAGAGTLTVSGTNTFEDITNDYSSTGATTITLTAGSSQSVNNFTANGSVGKLLTINSTSGTQATLTKSSGTVSSVYLRLQNNNANGGAFWGATQSTNLGNITGWNLRGPGLISFF